MNPDADYVSIGIPDDARQPVLRYCAAARCLILHVQTFIERRPVHRVFFRSLDQESYSPLGLWAPNETVSSIGVSCGSPVAIMAVDRISGSGPSMFDMNHIGLYTADLGHGTVKKVALSQEPGTVTTVGDVMGVSADGSRAFCVALAQPDPLGAPPIRGERFVAEVDLRNGTFIRLTQLRRPFF